jgi:class 3 adenylate cyclase/TolB-like protein
LIVAEERAERRLAAILAADIVGYSRLIEQDEAATLAAIRDLHRQVIDPLLAEHRGRIVKLMGDGAIAEFTSVVDAVTCAVAIQERVAQRQEETAPDRRIVLRIGINLGDVVVDGDDLLGDGVNVAARLEQLCEPGGVLVSGTAYDHLQGKLGLPLEFAGERRVKNIERPVRTYRVRVDGAPGRPARRAFPLPGRVIAAALALLLLSVGAATGAWWWHHTRAGSTAEQMMPEPPALAVLPFHNLSGDEQLSRFANGLAADIIADLSASRLLTVIAPGTSLASAEGARDARQIGRDLGVAYVLDGTLQGAGQRLRATAQLVDTATGAQLWSERFEPSGAELSAAQSELSQRVASRMVGSLHGVVFEAAVDAARRKPIEGLRPRELMLLSNEQRGLWTPEGNAKALELIQQAIALDPRDPAGYVQLAWIYHQQLVSGWASSDDEAVSAWLDAAKTAVKLDPTYPFARLVLGIGYNWVGDERAVVELERAVELAPGNAGILAEVAVELPVHGETERAVELIERAVLLDPTANFRWGEWWVYFYARRFEDAAAAIVAEDDPNRMGQLVAVMTYAQLGQAENYERWRARLRETWPDYSAELFLENGDFGQDAILERSLFLDSHVKAGLPICATPEQRARNPNIIRLPECAPVQARN